MTIGRSCDSDRSRAADTGGSPTSRLPHAHAGQGSHSASRPASSREWSAMLRQCERAARRLGADHVEAEDLAQEALARLLPVLPTVDRPSAWLHQVVRNLRVRQQRRRAERVRAYSDLAKQLEGHRSPAAAWREKIEIRRLLSQAPLRSRQLLALLLAGYTHREIAVVLGCETHQVGPRIARALRTARRRLEAAQSSTPESRGRPLPPL